MGKQGGACPTPGLRRITGGCLVARTLLLLGKAADGQAAVGVFRAEGVRLVLKVSSRCDSKLCIPYPARGVPRSVAQQERPASA